MGSIDETNQDQNLPGLRRIRIYFILHTKCPTYTSITISSGNFATISNAILKVYFIDLRLGKF